MTEAPLFKSVFNWRDILFQGRKSFQAGQDARNYRGQNAENRIRVLVFGDSNAYRPGNSEDCWPSLLQRMSGSRLHVINESRDGRTTRFDSGACNGLRSIKKKIRRAGQLNYVFIALGTNDVKNSYGPPDAAEVVEGIHRIIQVITRYHRDAEVILITPPPVGKVTSGDLEGAHRRIPAVIDGLVHYSIDHRIHHIDLSSKIDADVDLEDDRIHLNADGRKKVALAAWQCVYCERS